MALTRNVALSLFLGGSGWCLATGNHLYVNGPVDVADLLLPDVDVEVGRLLRTERAVLVAVHARGREAACP